ncbi:hypothetical protein TNCV_1455141 [Trichonephila clavipes]|nr:hypothetical protein TNCV_1455141 [Trichonephila clavipes]
MAKRDGGQHEKEAQNWGGEGQQEEAKATRTRRGRSQTRNWEKRSERQTTRTRVDGSRSCKRREQGIGTKQISMVHSS